MDWNDFITVALIHLLAVASPGPDFAIIVRHSLHHGRNSALMTSVGVGAGILVHVAYSIVGLSLVIATTPWLFEIIKYLATGYLLYLAYGAFKSTAQDHEVVNDSNDDNEKASMSYRKAFITGFITNGINPKATLFFLSLFTLVITPSTSLTIKLIYGAYLASATAIWFCFLSLILNHRHVITFMQKYSVWIDRVMGVLLVVVAFNILFFTGNA